MTRLGMGRDVWACADVRGWRVVVAVSPARAEKRP